MNEQLMMQLFASGAFGNSSAGQQGQGQGQPDMSNLMQAIGGGSDLASIFGSGGTAAESAKLGSSAIKGGASGASPVMAAVAAVPQALQWGNDIRNAIKAESQEVPDLNYSLYRNMQDPTYRYDGPVAGKELLQGGADFLSGAATGAQTGMQFGGPVGAAIGAGVGAIGASLDNFILAGKAKGLKNEWEDNVTEQMGETARHNSMVGLYNKKMQEKQNMLSGLDPYIQQAMTAY